MKKEMKTLIGTEEYSSFSSEAEFIFIDARNIDITIPADKWLTRYKLLDKDKEV